ncbi:unnamed protein product [Arctia plantaginis]|uniref:Uncharacterized protein n=1 Tax=Arctia plantaginis TaxID=874455 RepID=A0A8S1AX29_ARCPL|nr:unnamed protein product [Arctia plantaginis]
MEESCEMPDLLNIFTEIVCDRKDYCFVCLRTGDERRLVKPQSFQKFMAAAKLDARSDVLFVCYICERQATNALSLLHAAMFASSLSLVLTELCSRNIKSNQVLLEKKFFNKILTKVDLSNHLTPKVITEEVGRIRNNYHLSETETLVMDNKQIYEAVPIPVVGITMLRQPGPQAECPAPHRCTTPSILPDEEVTHEKQNPPPPETYVILDDEDDPLNPTSTSIDKEPPLNQTTLTSVVNLNNNLVITLDPPSLVTLEQLLAEQKKMPKDYILHPVFLTDSGEMNIPSLFAVITNDSLIFQDSLKQTTHSMPLQINTQIVKESLKTNREVFVQICKKFQLPAMNSNLVHRAIDKSCQNDFPVYPRKKMKIDGSMLHNALCKMKKGGSFKTADSSIVKQVMISDISSDMDEVPRLSKSGATKTNWEDKIPMDVISFVDAVDPNAHQMLKEMEPNGCDSVKVGNVRSLALKRGLDVDIIDLC